jgi:hypothetical protein
MGVTIIAVWRAAPEFDPDSESLRHQVQLRTYADFGEEWKSFQKVMVLEGWRSRVEVSSVAHFPTFPL